MTSSDLWDEDTAERYDDLSAEMFAPVELITRESLGVTCPE